MLVRIYVGDVNSGSLQLAKLRDGFRFNFSCIQLPAKSGGGEAEPSAAEIRSFRDEARNF